MNPDLERLMEPTVEDLTNLIHRPMPTLRPNESILKIVLTPTKAAITLDTYEVEETSQELRLTRHGLRLISWTKVPGPESTPWKCDGVMTVWDEDYEPVVIKKWGTVRSPEDAARKRDFERMCYRPGTERAPLDNYQRVLEGDYFDTEKAIESYW